MNDVHRNISVQNTIIQSFFFSKVEKNKFYKRFLHCDENLTIHTALTAKQNIYINVTAGFKVNIYKIKDLYITACVKLFYLYCMHGIIDHPLISNFPV